MNPLEMLSNKITLKKTIKYLNNKKVVGLPTETVYGLGGNAYSKNAIKKIYQIKGRPKFNPLIIHYYNLKDASQIVKLCEINNSKLFVNYFRRVEPGFLEVHSLINSSKFVKPFQGICYYSKGLFNTASHFINLFQFLFGEINGINILKKTDNILDPSPNFELEFSDGNIIFLANQNKSVFLNNIEIFMENVKLTFENGGRRIFWNEFIEDQKFPKYKIIDNQSLKINNDFNRIQYHFVEQINLEINNKFNTLCTGKQALETQKVLEEIKNKL